MGLFRLIIFSFFIYFCVKAIQKLFNDQRNKTDVQGTKRTNNPIDLSNADIEDAEYKDIS